MYRSLGIFAATLIAVLQTFDFASAELLLYEPFDYTPGSFLGGTDPDGAGPAIGTPIGQTNLNTGGGTWYARDSNAGTPAEPLNNYQSQFDTSVSSGSLSYPGLAAGVGNSVSYGSTTPATTSAPYYGNTISLPNPVSSGSLYASFILRLKSPFISSGSGIRSAVAGFVTETSTESEAGTRLPFQESTGGVFPASLWIRRDPANITLSNFSPGKSASDGIGPAATGPSTGWQTSNNANIESNQFGAVNGQSLVTAGDPNTYQTYFIVLKYQFNAMPSTNGQTDTVSLWMNPGSGTLGTANGETLASQSASGNVGSYYASVGAFGTATSDVSLSASGVINSFALIGYLRTTNATFAVDLDELRIGTTWASVTPAGAVSNANFNGDDAVDGDDFLIWQRGFGGAGALANGDANGDGNVNGTDFGIWKSQFGTTGLAASAGAAVPEPGSAVLAVMTFGAVRWLRRRRRTVHGD